MRAGELNNWCEIVFAPSFRDGCAVCGWCARERCANVTANIDQMLKLGETAIEHGANMLVVGVLTAGFSAVQMLTKDPSINVPLHIHRTIHGAITRKSNHGIHINGYRKAC